MRDDAGVVQLWIVPPVGGEPRQITRDTWDLASAFTWNPHGHAIAYLADGSVQVVEVETGCSRRLAPRTSAAPSPRPEACVFSPDGTKIAYVRQVPTGGEVVNQIFVADAC
jgi:Tol biopolymer transport system component